MFSFLKKEISIYVDKERRKGIFEIYKMNTLLLKSEKNSEIKTFMSHHELSGLCIQSYQPVLWLRAPESQMRPGSREHGTSRHPCSSLQVTWSQPSQFLTVHWEIKKKSANSRAGSGALKDRRTKNLESKACCGLRPKRQQAKSKNERERLPWGLQPSSEPPQSLKFTERDSPKSRVLTKNITNTRSGTWSKLPGTWRDNIWTKTRGRNSTFWPFK